MPILGRGKMAAFATLIPQLFEKYDGLPIGFIAKWKYEGFTGFYPY
ncbi:hypothetical protein [Chryseobacterium sp. JK1]